MTSLSSKQQPVCAIFIFTGLFWASPPLFLESKPGMSSSQREKQQCLGRAHRNVCRAGKEPFGLSWPVPKHQLGDGILTSSPGPAAPCLLFSPPMCTPDKLLLYYFKQGRLIRVSCKSGLKLPLCFLNKPESCWTAHAASGWISYFKTTFVAPPWKQLYL